jgi:hypothetical protein
MPLDTVRARLALEFRRIGVIDDSAKQAKPENCRLCEDGLKRIAVSILITFPLASSRTAQRLRGLYACLRYTALFSKIRPK